MVRINHCLPTEYIVDVELADPRADPEERLVALKFVVHLVGDLHAGERLALALNKALGGAP